MGAGLRIPGLFLVLGCMVLWARPGRAADDAAELRARIEEGNLEIEALQRRFEAQQQKRASSARIEIEEAALRRIVASYLQDNPGAGLPSGVQAGYEPDQGFVLRSAPAPRYARWADESRIPFELRIRGRLQLGYNFYKVTDTLNHQTGTQVEPPSGDRSQLVANRLRLSFEGTAFTPNLRYQLQLDTGTRGVGGLQGNEVVQTQGATDPNGAATSTIGGGVTTGQAVRLYTAFLAYDWRPCGAESGCGPDCPGTSRYAPTVTLLAGKFKPLFGLERFLGSSVLQLDEYSMAQAFFNQGLSQLAAGTAVRALDDRLFLQALLTNGNQGSIPNGLMDDLPGGNLAFWYDVGGSWDAQRKRWNLFGDSLSDSDYSCCPVARVGAAINLSPMGRRSIYGDAKQARILVMPARPGGRRLINVLNGGSQLPNEPLDDLDESAADDTGSEPFPNNSNHAADSFDAYCCDVFLAGKFHGFSIYNEWWLRTLTNFKAPPGGGSILYQDTLGPDGSTVNALFPGGPLIDYGMTLQAGYFIVPQRWEVVARWSWLRGDSGDINGKGTFATRFLPGVATPIQVVDGAFRQFHEADEYAVGLNYYFKRHSIKWQNDFSIYVGANPAGAGASAGGFIAGVDGWLVRSRIQLMF